MHEQEYTHTITMSTPVTIRLAGYSLGMLVLGTWLFGQITGGLDYRWWTIRDMLVWVLPVYFLSVIAHEWLHGLAFRFFGGKPQYGAGFVKMVPVAWATCPADRFTFRQMLGVGMAPFVGLSLIAVAGAWVYPDWKSGWLLAFVANFSGAVGDLWLSRRHAAFRHVPGVRFIDEKAHTRVVASAPLEEAAAAQATKDGTVGRFLTWWMGVAVSAWLASMVLVMVVPAVFPQLALWTPQDLVQAAVFGSNGMLGMVQTTALGLLVALLMSNTVRDVVRRPHL